MRCAPSSSVCPLSCRARALRQLGDHALGAALQRLFHGRPAILRKIPLLQQAPGFFPGQTLQGKAFRKDVVHVRRQAESLLSMAFAFDM